MHRSMAARLSRSLPQVNRQVFTRLSSRAIPIANARHAGLAHRNTWNLAPRNRVLQAGTRYAHTDAGAANSGPAMLDATGFKGSIVSEKHWKNQGLPVVDALIEPRAILHFMGFITQGVLPNGKKTDLALLEPDEFPLFMNPSSEWAAAPFNKGTVPTVQKAMERLAGAEDLSGVCQIGHNMQFLKSRLWGGIPPVPAPQWRDKELNDPKNFVVAHEYLTSVIAVFEYLNIPQIQQNMRDTFNKVSADLAEMQEALNARRKAQGAFTPNLNLPALWEEFIRAQYEVMTSTAHSWVLARAAELREPILESFTAISPENQQSPEMAALSSRWSDLLAVVSMADFRIWLSMDGYNSYNPPSEIVAGLHNPERANQEQNYDFAKLLMARLTKCVEAQNEAARVQGPSATQSDAARRERLLISSVLQDELRENIRGRTPSPQPPVQPWIQQLLRAHEQIMSMDPEERKNLGFGIAIYRSTYGFPDANWEDLKRHVEADLLAWGDDLPGAAELKPLLKLHWFDIKDQDNTPESPAHAARKHFKELRSSDEWTHKLAPSLILIADNWAGFSYLEPRYSAAKHQMEGFLKGDFQGHVLAVDPDFEEGTTPTLLSEKDSEDPESTGIEYFGHMRIKGDLVWSELYSMLMMQSVRLENLWLQSRYHPVNMYSGLTVPSQVEPWKKCNVVQNKGRDETYENIKQHNPALAENYQQMRKEGSL